MEANTRAVVVLAVCGMKQAKIVCLQNVPEEVLDGCVVWTMILMPVMVHHIVGRLICNVAIYGALCNNKI